MRISQRLFIIFWTCIYDYIPCFMRSMSILEEMLEMFATTVQTELKTRRFMFAKVACKTSSLIAAILRRMLFSSSSMVRGFLANGSWISLTKTSSEMAIFSRMEPHATPRMRAWPKSKAFLMTGLFRKPYGRQDLLTSVRPNVSCGAPYKEKLVPTSHPPYRNWKTTFDVKLLLLVRTSCRPLSQTWSVAFSSAWTVVANISSISSSIDMLLMKQGM